MFIMTGIPSSSADREAMENEQEPKKNPYLDISMTQTEVETECRLQLKQSQFLLQLRSSLLPQSLINTASAATVGLWLQLTDQSSGEIWQGSFSPQYIEDITSKTGNFKRYLVFVEMLLSAMKQQTPTVHLDLLTAEDLQVLRRQQQQQQQQHHNIPLDDNKRYLILTYAVAYDRVHYPLPLKKTTASAARQQQQPSKLPQSFNNNNNNNGNGLLIEQLKQELMETKHELTQQSQRIQLMLAENERLRSDMERGRQESRVQLQQQQLQFQHHHQQQILLQQQQRKSIVEDKDVVKENLRLRREIEALLSGREAVEKAFSRLRDETRQEFQSIQREFHRLTNELSNNATSTDHLDVQLNRCYKLIEQLLEELKSEKMKSSGLITEKDRTIQQLREELAYWTATRERASVYSGSRLSTGRRSVGAASTLRTRALSSDSLARSSAVPASARHPRTPTTRRSQSQDSFRLSARRQPLPPPSNGKSTASNGNRFTTARLPSPSPVRRQPSPARSNASQSSPYKRFDPTTYVQERDRKMRERQRSNSAGSLRSVSRDSVRERPSPQATLTATPRQYKTIVPRKPPPSQQLQQQQQKRTVKQQPQPVKPTTTKAAELTKSLRAIQPSDIDARLSVLQSYFERIRQ